mmetsp:Transcript_22056/g.47745  ORF Transcript_22056/g.47745 Transcript_22056/m.47745 type:complete len:653 (+) Transcript_22056:188-2146(+)
MQLPDQPPPNQQPATFYDNVSTDQSYGDNPDMLDYNTDDDDDIEMDEVTAESNEEEVEEEEYEEEVEEESNEEEEEDDDDDDDDDEEKEEFGDEDDEEEYEDEDEDEDLEVAADNAAIYNQHLMEEQEMQEQQQRDMQPRAAGVPPYGYPYPPQQPPPQPYGQYYGGYPPEQAYYPPPQQKKSPQEERRSTLTCCMTLILGSLCCVALCIAALLVLWLSEINPLEDDDGNNETIIFVNATTAPRDTTFPPTTAPTPASPWQLTGTVLPATGNENAGFGTQVGYVNGVLVSSLPSLSTIAKDQGAIQTFTRGPESRSAPLEDSSATDNVAEDFGAAIDMTLLRTSDTETVVSMIVGATQTLGAVQDLVSFGSASVYTNQDGEWIQTGGIIRTDEALEEAQGLFGYAVSLATDQLRVAIGAPSSSLSLQQLNVGRVYTFDYDGTNWVKSTPAPLSSSETHSFFGGAVDISKDGNSILVGAPGSLPIDGSSSGTVSAYTFVAGTPNVWSPVSVNIVSSQSSTESLGATVTWIEETDTVRRFAVGGPRFSINRGIIRVFELSGGIYQEIGTILGAAGEFVGTSLCSSETGRIGFGTTTGAVRMYDEVDGAWTLVEGAENLSTPGNAAVVSCSMSADGTTLVAGLASEAVAIYDLSA